MGWLVSFNMKDILITLVCNVVSITAMLIAGILVYEGKPHWGWFLTSSIISICAYKSSKSEKSDDCCGGGCCKN